MFNGSARIWQLQICFIPVCQLLPFKGGKLAKELDSKPPSHRSKGQSYSPPQIFLNYRAQGECNTRIFYIFRQQIVLGINQWRISGAGPYRSLLGWGCEVLWVLAAITENDRPRFHGCRPASRVVIVALTAARSGSRLKLFAEVALLIASIGEVAVCYCGLDQPS